MRTMAGFCLALALITASLGASYAQGRIPYALILICNIDENSGPKVLANQPSKALEDLCQAPGEDDFSLCRALGEVAGETSCATALATLNRFGIVQAANHTKTFLPSNFRVELGGLPADDPVTLTRQALVDDLLPFERQPDILYTLKSADHAVSLVSCDFSESVPRLRSVQSSHADGDDAVAGVGDAVSCADGLQAQLALGETIVDTVTVRGWNPTNKFAIAGDADPRALIPETDDQVLVGFSGGDLNQIVYIYVLSGDDF
jgi:hypothetical protein